MTLTLVEALLDGVDALEAFPQQSNALEEGVSDHEQRPNQGNGLGEINDGLGNVEPHVSLQALA